MKILLPSRPLIASRVAIFWKLVQVRRLLQKAYAPSYVNRLARIGDRVRCILPEALVAVDRSGSAPVGPGDAVSMSAFALPSAGLAYIHSCYIQTPELGLSFCYVIFRLNQRDSTVQQRATVEPPQIRMQASERHSSRRISKRHNVSIAHFITRDTWAVPAPASPAPAAAAAAAVDAVSACLQSCMPDNGSFYQPRLQFACLTCVCPHSSARHSVARNPGAVWKQSFSTADADNGCTARAVSRGARTHEETHPRGNAKPM